MRQKMSYWHLLLRVPRGNFMAADLSSEEKVVRLFIATIGYRMGIDYKKIRMIVHWKEQTNVQKYGLEIGRAG